MRLIRVLGILALAFGVLDFVLSVTSAPACGRLAKLLWFVPDLRPLTSAFVSYVVGVFGVAFVYGILVLALLAVMSRLSGGRFDGHIAAALVNAVLGRIIGVVLVAAILHHAIQSLVALLC